MAGKITVSTINDSSGVLATQNGMTGIAKAWVNFTGGNGNTAGTINQSFNVSSVTVNGTGDYTVNFTTAMANTNYCVICGCQEDVANSTLQTNRMLAPARTPTAVSTGSVRVIATYPAGASIQTIYNGYVSILTA
jgi:hypothetical protein